MYGTWRVSELKAELKKCNGSVRGKKADLIERLELFDKHFNFGQPECLDEEENTMRVPQNESYKDINSDSPLPVLNKTKIRHYLNFTEKKFVAATQLYESRFLVTARSCVCGQNTFLKGICKKTMKNLHYEVDIKLDEYGNPEEAHCECPAGSGINATCKHVAVLLLGVEQMVREKMLLKFEVCTEKLQQFHVPKKQYTGSPIRTEKLSRHKKRQNVIFEPYDTSKVDKANYNSRIRNLVLNFPNTNMPIKQLYAPANPYALETDHCYTDTNPTDKLLEDLKLSQISVAEIEQIEQATRGQTHSAEWHQYRKNRLTSYKFHTMCHLRPATMETYSNQIIDPSPFHSKATNHGIINEKIALNKYCTDYGLQVKPCGLFISKERPYLASSPDGLLGEETTIEIKCPYTSRYQVVNSITVPYLVENDCSFSLKTTAPYYYQIQGQLYCTNRKYCNLIVYTYKDMKVINVWRDDAFISYMLTKLDYFYQNHFVKALCNKYLYFNYDDKMKK